MTTVAAAVQEALDLAGFNPDDGLFDTSTTAGARAAVSMVNEAQRAVAGLTNWPYFYVETTFNTVGGTAAYTPPAGWFRTEFLAYQNIQIVNRTRRSLIRWALWQGIPRFYTIMGEDITLCPIPDGVYVINHGYYRKPVDVTAVTSTGSTVDIPADMWALFIARLMWDIAQRLKDQMLSITADKAWAEAQKLHLDEQRKSAATGVPITRVDGW